MKKLLLTGLAICLMMVSCKREIPENESPAVTPSANPASMASKAAVPGVCKVYFSEEMTALIEESLAAGDGIVTKSSALNSLVDELGITSMRRLFPDAGEYEPRTRAEGLHRWYKITFDKVLAVSADDGFKTGKPTLDGATVSANVVKNGKSKKIYARRSQQAAYA